MKRKLLAFLLALVSALSFCVSAFASPVTVATSTVTTAVSSPQQRSPMYVNGFHWAFFSDGTNFKCYSSADGITFASATGWVDRAATSANRFSVALDSVNGSRFSYVYVRSSNNYLYWRQGILNDDGSVSWDQTERTIVSTLTIPFYPSVDYDGTGKAWVGVTFLYSSYPSNYYWRVYLNSATDGTWSTDPQYPVDLLTAQSVSVRGCVLGLTTNGAVTLYPKTIPIIYSWELDGAGKVGSEQTASDSQAFTVNDWSATKNGNIIILQWHNQNTPPWSIQFRCAQRVSGVWGASSQIGTQTQSGECAPFASVDTSTGDIYCVISKIVSATSYTYYKNGVLVESREEPTGFYDQVTLQTSLQTYGNMLCILWLQSGSSPRNVRYEAISVAAGPSEVTWRLGTSSIVFCYERWIVQKTYRETDLACMVEGKRFLVSYSWRPSAVSLAIQSVNYQRLAFLFRPSVLSWSIGSERIMRETSFGHGDGSTSLVGLGLLMHYRYDSGDVAESAGSREFRKHLIFQQTGLSETLGSVAWSKIIGFVVYLESQTSETAGSVRWMWETSFNRGDISSLVPSLSWLTHYRYGESGISEAVGSSQFVKQLVFRETGLSETLSSLVWTKMAEFVVWTESTISETVGSVSWALGLGLDYRPLLILFSILACVVGVLLFYWYRDKE